LFLCSPPKIILVLRPASFATLTKLTPSGADGGGAGAGGLALASWRNGGTLSGRASERIFAKGRTRAERLSDFRNLRRDEDKRSIPSQLSLVLDSAQFFYINRPAILQVGPQAD
jgi:hypothetical protein